ncbi:hypothetical protein HYDPIDRAFT_22971 [Hydnomerulius pinastri MD-312]|nr:hypothetical protein HYDPIDRAFT_22971 [Hydnomerulius pinastri MD-312]
MPAAKRASDSGEGSSSSKRARINHEDGKALVKAILAKPDTYPILDDDDAVRRSLVALAQYAKDLEGELKNGGEGGAAAPKTLTPEQLQAAVEKIRKAANSGIKKQMSGGTAKWTYDGVCADPLVFGTLLKLGGPPKFKMHKMPKDEFNQCLGGISSSARYSHLSLTGTHVNIRWTDSREFKFSGTYGV